MTDENSVAADEGTTKRSIQMKMFTTPKQHKEVAFKNEAQTVGQIIGEIFSVKEKVGTLPGGDSKVSLLAFGDFEAVNYTTGEVFQSTAAYLPQYYLETVQAMLEKPDVHSLLFAVEIVVAPTGKTIPTAYEVRNLVRRRPENAVNLLKAELAKAGRLRLPPPTERSAGAIEGEVLNVEPLRLEDAAASHANSSANTPAPEIDPAAAPDDDAELEAMIAAEEASKAEKKAKKNGNHAEA